VASTTCAAWKALIQLDSRKTESERLSIFNQAGQNAEADGEVWQKPSLLWTGGRGDKPAR